MLAPCLVLIRYVSAPYTDHVGVIVCDEHSHVLNQGSIGRYCHVQVVKTERELFELFIATVKQVRIT